MIIGFNPNYPALHMHKALEVIVSGKAADHGWDAADIASIVAQANTLIAERGKSIGQYGVEELQSLLNLCKESENA